MSSLKNPILVFVLGGLLILTVVYKGIAPDKDTRLQVAGIVFQDDQFMRLIELGMKDAAAKNDINILCSNSYAAVDKEYSLVETYIARKVDYIAIDPLSNTASISALKRAYNSGVKIITFDGSIKADFPICNIRSDQGQLGAATGKAARDYIVNNMGGKANIAMLEYMALAPEICSARANGFKSQLKDLDGVKIVAEQDAWVAPKAIEVVQGIMAANPEVNVIWAANEGGTVGAARAIQQLGKSGQVFVFGTDMSSEIGSLLLSDANVLQAVTGQKPFDIGTSAIQTALMDKNNQHVDKIIELPGITFERKNTKEIRDYKAYLDKIGG